MLHDIEKMTCQEVESLKVSYLSIPLQKAIENVSKLAFKFLLCLRNFNVGVRSHNVHLDLVEVWVWVNQVYTVLELGVVAGVGLELA